MKSTIVLLTACLTCAAHLALAATYYISPTGSDSNSGTSPAHPWETFAHVDGGSFNPGDRILLKGGATISGSIVLVAPTAGTPTKPIVIGSYGNSQATISAGANTGIFIENSAGYKISDLNIVGGWNATTQSGNNGSGIYFYNDMPGDTKLPYLHIANCDIGGFNAGGITIGSSASDGTKSGYSDVRITDCVCHDNGADGIGSYGYFDPNSTEYSHTSFTVSDCTVYNNLGISSGLSNSGNGIVLGDVQNGLIERCESYDNGGANLTPGGGPVGIWFWDSDHCIIEHCEAYSNHSANGEDGDGFDLDGGCTNCIMQYNYSHDNDAAGFPLFEFTGARPFHNNTIRYDITQDDCRAQPYGPITIWTGGDPIVDCQIYNNTVYVDSSASGPPAAVDFFTPAQSLGVENNIFITTGSIPMVDAPSGMSGVNFDHNNYWPSGGALSLNWAGATYTSLANWEKSTGEEMNGNKREGLKVDPQLTASGEGPTIGNPYDLSTLSAYTLLAGSPMIGRGLDLHNPPYSLNPGSSDFYGNPIGHGAGYDLGAD